MDIILFIKSPNGQYTAQAFEFGTNNLTGEIERNLIRLCLDQCNGIQRRTAKMLGMPKSTLHDRLKEYFLLKAENILSTPSVDTGHSEMFSGS